MQSVLIVVLWNKLRVRYKGISLGEVFRVQLLLVGISRELLFVNVNSGRKSNR